MGDTAILKGDSRQMEERALTMRLLRHQNVGDSEEPVMLAQDLMSANRLRDARLVCMTALHKDPSDVDLLLTGAGIAETLGEHVDARTLLVKAARLVPEWIEPMIRLARLLYRMEDFGRAWAAVERCYSMDPTSAQTCALRADIEQAHRLTLRMNRFLAHEHADDAAMLANALVADSRFDDALVVLDHALERDGEDADALFVKGTILKARGERALAEIALRRVTQMECGWVEAWETMADLLEEKGDRAHAERLRAHAATIEVDPLMLVDMAVIAGAPEAAFADLTMSDDLDRAVAAGVSAMSDLKRSLVTVRAPAATPVEAVTLTASTDPSMLIRNVDAIFARASHAVASAALPSSSTANANPSNMDPDFTPESVEAALIPALQFLVDDISDPNPAKGRSIGDTLPLGTYKPTTPPPTANKAVETRATATKPNPKAKTHQTASGEFTAPPLHSDSSRPGPRQNGLDVQRDAPIATYAEAMALRAAAILVDEAAERRHDESQAEAEGMTAGPQDGEALIAEAIAIKAHCAAMKAQRAKRAILPASPLAPSRIITIENPVSVRRIINVRGRASGGREEVCVIRDGEAKPLSMLLEETEADLDALLADDTLFPIAAPVTTFTDDEDFFPIDAEAAAFASVDIELDFPIDAEAEQFPSIDIDVAPLSAPPAPSREASIRYQMFAYLTGQEFERSAGGAHHVGFVATDSFEVPRSTLRVRDGKVTLESLAPIDETEALASVEAITHTPIVSTAVVETSETSVKAPVVATPIFVETPASLGEAPVVVEATSASAETQEALADLMDAQISFALSVESKAVLEELLSLQTVETAETQTAETQTAATQTAATQTAETQTAETQTTEPVDPFDALASDDADTVFDETLAFAAITKALSAGPETICEAEPKIIEASPEAKVSAEADDIAIPLAVRKKPTHKTLILRPKLVADLDLRSQILAAAGVDADALETALQATRPSDLKEAEEDLDSFIEEVVKRPRLRMRSAKGAPYRPPSPRDLFPKYTVDEETSSELNA